MTIQSIDYQALASVLLNSSTVASQFEDGIRRTVPFGLFQSMGRNDLIRRSQSSGE